MNAIAISELVRRHEAQGLAHSLMALDNIRTNSGPKEDSLKLAEQHFNVASHLRSLADRKGKEEIAMAEKAKRLAAHYGD